MYGPNVMKLSSAGIAFALVACGGNSSDHTVDASPDAPAEPAGVDVPLGSLEAFSYTLPLAIDGTTFTEIVDTGSTSTGVAATGCSGCGVTPLYTPGSAAVDTKMTASTQYADGSGWSGEIYKDSVSITGTPAVDLSFVAVTDQSQFFDGNSYQGIMGFGPSQLLEPGTTSYMDLATAAGMNPMVAFRLCPDRGDMWLGGFDPTAAASAVQFTPMLPIDDQNNPFYSVQIADMSFGGTSLGLTTASFGPTLVDTGTSISFVPTAVENSMLSAVNNSSAFKSLFPGSTLADTDQGACVTNASATSAMVDAMLPPFSISFPLASGGNFQVDIAPTRSYLTPSGGGQFCWAFTSGGTAADGSLIGDTLLAGMLAVFDIKNLQMGFAPEAGCVEADVARIHPAYPRPSASPFFRGPPARRTHAVR